MSYFEDLSLYTYMGRKLNENYKILNIGWLDKTHSYNKGNVNIQILENIKEFISVNLMMARGFHVCNLCSNAKNLPLILKYKDKKLKLGFAEIRVFGDNKTIYAAPNLIYHYMLEHNYKPPDEFINAVLNGPSPYSSEYNKLLQVNNWKANEYYKLIQRFKEGNPEEK